MNIEEIERKVYRLDGRRQEIISDIKRNKIKRIELIREKNIVNQCLDVFQLLSELKKKQVKIKIEALVTKGLQTIFERDDYEFEIVMQQKRGVMTAKPMLHSKFKGRDFSSEVMDGHGGGIVNVISFILQVIVLLSIRPKLERIIVADEPFENVSKEYLNNVADFIKYLADISGMQIILVTHKDEFLDVADKKFKVSLNKRGVSIIKVLK